MKNPGSAMEPVVDVLMLPIFIVISPSQLLINIPENTAFKNRINYLEKLYQHKACEQDMAIKQK